MEDNERLSMSENSFDGEIVERQEEDCENMMRERQQKRAELQKKLESLHARTSSSSSDKVKCRLNNLSGTTVNKSDNEANHHEDDDDEFDDDEYFSAYLVDY